MALNLPQTSLLLLADLKSLASATPGPIIFAGDFNLKLMLMCWTKFQSNNFVVVYALYKV